MVEMMRGYEPPMERQFDEITPLEETTIEEPIVPISEIGSTVLDNAANKHILQNVEEKIRLGAKKIQIIVSGSQQGISGLASGHGKDVRREVKEKTKATGVEITGVELSPQRVQGLSGYDQRSGSISEEQRRQNLNEVKYAIKFAADVAEGGGVDILSNEFQRSIVGAQWHEKEAKKGFEFFDHSEKELEDIKEAQQLRYLVDKRTGQPIQQSAVRTNMKIHRVEYQTAKDRKLEGTVDASGRKLKPDDLVDIEGNYIDRFDEEKWRKALPKLDPATRQFQMDTVDWDDLTRETREFNKGKPEDEQLTIEEYAFRQRMESQRAQVQGQAYHWGRMLDAQYDQLEHAAKIKKLAKDVEGDMTPEQRRAWVRDNIVARMQGTISGKRAQDLVNMDPSKAAEELIRMQQHDIYGNQEQVRSLLAQVEELDEVMANVETPDHYAKKKVFDSYKDAGIYAWEKTKEMGLKKPLYVGPEIGWAGQSYGGHPEEFKELILKSREEMARELKEKRGLTEEAAKETAKKHIKGMLDTSHVSMWYKHLKGKPGESEDQKLNRFNKWMKDQVVDLVKSGVVGSVQLVDSITGEHSHLPAGQGIFDMVGLIKEMKKAGYDGSIVSEGHEEDGFNQGRILTETWRALGSPIRSMTPGRGGLGTWGGIQNSYFGHRSSPSYIVGAYVPSNEWQLWSDTPFE